MAYQARGRDPIFDQKTQAVIERRGKEMVGFGLIAAGIAMTMLLVSYSPDDPGWFAATGGEVQNWLGRLGAALASPLSVIAGLGAWGFALALGVWGLRLVRHVGEERLLARAVFVPIAVALGSIYASTLVPGAGWTHSFGLGGLFGDTVAGAVLNAMPFNTGASIRILSLLAGLATLVVGLFALGVDRLELVRGRQFLIYGVVMGYAGLMSLVGKGAKGAAVGVAGAARGAVRGAVAKRAEARAQREAEEAYWNAHPEPLQEQMQSYDETALVEPEPAAGGALGALTQALRARGGGQAGGFEEQAQLTDGSGEFSAPPPLRAAKVVRPEGMQQPVMQAQEAHVSAPQPPSASTPLGRALLARMPMLKKRTPMAAPEQLVPPAHMQEQPPLPELKEVDHLDGEDRISAKVANVLISKKREAMQAARQEPPVMRRRGPDPIILDTSTPVAGTPAMHEAAMHEPAMHEAPYALEPEMMAHPVDELIEEPVGYAPVAQPMAPPAPAQEPRNLVQHKPRKPAQASARAKAEAQPRLQFDDNRPAYELPPLGLLLDPTSVERHHLSDEALEENARMLEVVLDDYGVKGEIVSVRPGPVVTMYELEPAPGLKASRVIGLADDIARSMSALSARVSTVPGRSVIGIELPNENREKVVLREILATRDFDDSNMRLPLALGKDIGGDPIVANLAKMPHLLIAGTTGSGKSVAINTMILSLLYRLTPDECRMIMIDPKMLELSVYDGIPHLLSPVVTDPKKAVVALKWVVGEMEERYRKMSKMGVRNIEGYNSRVTDTLSRGEMFSRTVQTGFDEDTGEPIFETEEITPEKLPYIVVIVDEMADLMMVAGKEIEACIQRLAQMARASGIHIIMATQRPSVDVITGTIKANFPTRISFQVTSKVDSRTILGEQGAEQLLGMGDMLYMAGGAKITRVHGPFVSDEEVEEIVANLKSYGPPDYVGGVVEGPDEGNASDIDAVLGLGGNTNGEDALYDQAVAIVIKDRKCSTSYIQRKLAIGYNKAARLVEQMEDEGVVSSANHVGKREILVPEQQ
jgi:S-DNA-T family DNA segregation ATPase FtsK/SpoIIIE